MLSRAKFDSMIANLSDDETRCELSDYAVNTLREAFGRDASRLVAEESARIRREGITTVRGYLHCRRSGSSFRLNRGQRICVFAVYACRNLR